MVLTFMFPSLILLILLILLVLWILHVHVYNISFVMQHNTYTIILTPSFVL